MQLHECFKRSSCAIACDLLQFLKPEKLFRIKLTCLGRHAQNKTVQRNHFRDSPVGPLPSAPSDPKSFLKKCLSSTRLCLVAFLTWDPSATFYISPNLKFQPRMLKFLSAHLTVFLLAAQRANNHKHEVKALLMARMFNWDHPSSLKLGSKDLNVISEMNCLGQWFL